MAGNVTAFNTVWTFDIYQAYLRPNQPEQHYVWMGRFATVVGTLLSVGTSYMVMRFSNMGDYLVLIFSLFLFPLSTAFLLGMFWKRTTSSGAFYGMIAGVGSNVVHYALYFFGVVHYRTEMAANIYIIIVGWLLAFLVIVGLSLVTQPRPESELQGLVYSLSRTLRGHAMPWYIDPKTWAVALLLMLGLLGVVFW